MISHHTLVVLVENKAGVLARLAGLFARRGFNIESLAVAPTPNPKLSRVSIVVDVEALSMDQVKKQLDKLINVVDIKELAPSQAVEQELMMLSVSGDEKEIPEVMALTEQYGAEILDSSPQAVILSVKGETSFLDELEESLSRFNLIEIQRTGKIAISRLSQSAE